MALVITQPVDTGIAGQDILHEIIPPNTTKSVDVIDCAINMGVKWLISLTNDNSGYILAQEVLAVHRSPQVTHNRYGLCGDMVPHGLDVIIGGSGCMELQITNPSLTDTYSVDIVRIQILD